MRPPPHDRTGPRASVRRWTTLALVACAACSGGDPPADDLPDGTPVVLERPPAFPPAIAYKLAALEPAGDRWDCEVAAELAGAALGRLAERLAQPGAALDGDLAHLGELADDGFTCAVGAYAEPIPVRVGEDLAVRRAAPASTAPPSTGPASTAPASHGPAGLRDALALLLAPFDGDRGVRLTFELDRASVDDGFADGAGLFRTEGPAQLFGHDAAGALLQRNLRLACTWRRDGDRARLVALAPGPVEDVRGPAGGRPLFEDCTRSALGADARYEELVLRGVPYWNASLDKALDTAVFGHNGLAVGDADGDGLEDLYVCQAGGLPNQLLVRAADGTATDRAAALGLDVLDFTRSALFADLDADGDQDLVLATAKELVVFANEPGAPFRRALSLPVTATALAAADADGDGRVDLYVARYSRPESLWPVPYHDAENGPSNVLLRNVGGLRFEVATEALGLDASNERYSFAAGFLDYDADGDQDLYVANDFGRNVLYLNDGGRFREATDAAGARDMAAGMSVSWGDYDADGTPDVYVANMFSTAGSRLAHQAGFRGPATAEHYRRHARGNTLLRGRGDGTFEDVSVTAGVAQGRWAWGTAFADVDNDGRLDLAVANGYLTNAGPDLLCSYFWRQVVGLSPDGPDEVIPAYEDGWAALSDLQRRYSFNGHERNCLFLNTGTPRFADASAVAGVDFPDDGRALAVVDWDADGALDLWISARTAPRLRLLRNTNPAARRSVMLRLVDRDASPDAIGARVDLELDSGATLARFVVAGDGFLSQSTRWLHFGLGDAAPVRATVTWPDGAREVVEGLDGPGRYRLARGRGRAEPAPRPAVASRLAPAAAQASPPSPAPRPLVRLAAPLPLFGLEALDAAGRPRPVAPRDGRPRCVVLWDDGDASTAALARLAGTAAGRAGDVLAVGVLPPERRGPAAAALNDRGVDLELAFATDDLLDVLELFLRSVFEQPPPLVLPTALVVDAQGRLTALARGRVDAAAVVAELGRGDLAPAARRALATPFEGTWLGDPPRRSLQALAAVLRRHERLELAADVLALELPGGAGAGDAPLEGDAAKRLADAQELLGRELASKQQWQQAAEAFEACLALDPARPRVHVELGNALRGLERPADALREYERALALDPESADAHYSVGLMRALAGAFAEAERSFASAVRHDPDRPLAHFNLGVSLARQSKFDAAARSFARTLELDPGYLSATSMLAAVHEQRGDATAAIAVYQQGLERHPDEPRLLFGLGRAHLASGDRAGAEAARARLARVQPDLAARLASEIARQP